MCSSPRSPSRSACATRPSCACRPARRRWTCRRAAAAAASRLRWLLCCCACLPRAPRQPTSALFPARRALPHLRRTCPLCCCPSPPAAGGHRARAGRPGPPPHRRHVRRRQRRHPGRQRRRAAARDHWDGARHRPLHSRAGESTPSLPSRSLFTLLSGRGSHRAQSAGCCAGSHALLVACSSPAGLCQCALLDICAASCLCCVCPDRRMSRPVDWTRIPQTISCTL